MEELFSNKHSPEDRFRACFQDHWSAVCKYFYSRGTGLHSEDLTNEVFATAWRRWGDVPKDPVPWLFVTARNHLANHIRKTRDELELHDSITVSPEDGLVVSAQLSEQVQELLAAVETLPALERELLLLVAWDELTPAQAAQVVGCSSGTARARLFRARRRLKACCLNKPMTRFTIQEMTTNA